MQFPTQKNSPNERGRVREDNSTILEFVITDGNVPAGQIPKSAISSAVLTLYDSASGDIINNRDRVDIMDYITDDGATTTFAMNLTAADNPIWGDECTEETHVVVIEITASSGSNELACRDEIGIPVINLPHYRRTEHNTLTIGKTVRLMWRTL